MKIEVRGTGVHNKGAELMLCAIRQRFLERNPETQLVVDAAFGPYPSRAKYGLWTKTPTRGRGRAFLISHIATSKYRQTVGLVAEHEIDAIVDASGFAFSDQWGPKPAEILARDSQRWRNASKKSVLLPQAFGPFENPRVRDAMKRTLDNVCLVFARDEMSLQYLRDLGTTAAVVKLAPDFTNIVSPGDTSDIELPNRLVSFVPNIRMLDRAEGSESTRYIAFLVQCMRTVTDHDLSPVMIHHVPGGDERVTEMVERELGWKIARIEEPCPMRLKGILSRSMLVVGSRYHALVGALSSGVPCIATSWSHKYAALFKDYECEESILQADASTENIEQCVANAVKDTTRARLRNSLLRKSDHFKHLAHEMFTEVEALIGM